ncbi:MAG: hypothetical protein ACJ8DC_00015 [Gemmatimonadales bacterium]
MRAVARVAGLLAAPLLLVPGLHAQAPIALITLTGGPHAGIYEMSGSPICKTFDSGSDDRGFGAEFVADPPHGWRKGPPYLSHLWLTTPRMRNPKPDAVSLGVTFTKWGTPATEIDYKVYTIPPALDNNPELGRKQTGKGQATVRRAADKLSATFTGETADGVRMEGSVECP